MAKTTAQKEKKAKREMTPQTRVVTFNIHRALKGYVSADRGRLKFKHRERN
jgi:hypothetical protein